MSGISIRREWLKRRKRYSRRGSLFYQGAFVVVLLIVLLYFLAKLQ